jgi:Type IV secretion system pilin
MNFIKKNWDKLILIVYTFVVPAISLAQSENCDPAKGKICPTVGATSIPDLIKTILEGALKIGIPIIALAIIYCGFLFVFARGNPEKLTKAKDALLYTLIGAAILLGSWAIATMIQGTVNAL